MPLFNAVGGSSAPRATYEKNGVKSSVKAFDYLDTDNDNIEDTYRYNGDTLYVLSDVEIVNYNDLLTNINDS